MEWVKSILLGLVFGFTDIFPVSSRAHYVLFGHMIGMPQAAALIRAGAHLAILVAILFSCRTQLRRLRREKLLAQAPRRRRKRQPLRAYILLGQMWKLSGWITVIGLAFYQKLIFLEEQLLWVAGLVLLNGLILFLPTRLPSGNKDSQNFTRLDGFLMGLGGALSALPGLSRTGAITAFGTARGGERRYVFDFSLLVSIPALVLLFAWDTAGLFTGALAGISLVSVLQAILGMGAAFLSSLAAIRGMRFIAVKVGFGGFSYYCWGAALFTFILYLL